MYFARLSEYFMSLCDKYFHFAFNITRDTSSDFLQKLQISGEVFSPPEPSRAKFTPSGRVFRLSRPLAWTLYIQKALVQNLLQFLFCLLVVDLTKKKSFLMRICCTSIIIKEKQITDKFKGGRFTPG